MFTIKKLINENKGFLMFIFGMVFVRCAFADWYIVPSASMYPSLLIGDRVFANKLAYDFKLPFTDVVLKKISDPQRGDIVTFSSPEDGTRLVKRLIAVPGDVVEMRNEELIINGVKADYQPVADAAPDHFNPEFGGQQLMFTETMGALKHGILVMPEVAARRNFAPVTVPAGEYMMLGDNRDNSKDSRYIGLVKRELITGQVKRVLFSLDSNHYYLPRINRFGVAVASNS